MPEQKDSTNRKLLLEIGLVLISCIFLYSFLSSITPTESDTDILWYMNMGKNNIPYLRWMTRFGHVYPLKAFMFLAGSPIEGGHYFWAFLITTTSGLIYLNARTLLRSSTYVHGILAVGIFLSVYIHPRLAGQAWADFTSMFVISLLIFVFLYSARRDHQSRWLLMAIGLIFFWVFETKETAWVSAILLAALGFDLEEKFDYRLFWTRFKMVLGGAAVGILIYMVLNGIFLKDFFFGLRPSQLSDFFRHWMGEDAHLLSAANWYQSVLFAKIPILFLLFIATILKVGGKDAPLPVKMTWSIPIVLILLLTIGQITSFFAIYDRLFLPGTVILSFTAPQFISYEKPATPREKKTFWVMILVGALLFHFVITGIRIFTSINEINFHEFIRHVLTPAVLSFLIILLILFDRYTAYAAVLPIYCVVAIFFFPLKANYRSILNPTPGATTQSRFYLFERFSEYIEYSEGMLVYVSPEIPAKYNAGDDNPDVLFTVFDLYFSTRTNRDNFSTEPSLEVVLPHLLEGRYTYLFLTDEDWGTLIENPEDESIILQQCQILEDDGKPIFFLKCD